MSVKAIVINASPNMDRGNTAVILTPFIEGMKEAGAQVEIVYTSKMQINPCQAEHGCWFRTPGVCFQNDDMKWFLPRYAESDTLVVATPLYTHGMPGPLKNLLDRLISTGLPFIEVHDGHCRHPRREDVKVTHMALVSSCALWEIDNFDLLVAHTKAVAEAAGISFAGALLRPHGPILKAMIEAGRPFPDILEAAKEAGRELVATGSMPASALKIVSKPLLPQEIYVKMANEKVTQALSAMGADEKK